jgi:hypothetical protein
MKYKAAEIRAKEAYVKGYHMDDNEACEGKEDSVKLLHAQEAREKLAERQQELFRRNVDNFQHEMNYAIENGDCMVTLDYYKSRFKSIKKTRWRKRIKSLEFKHAHDVLFIEYLKSQGFGLVFDSRNNECIYIEISW